MADIRPIIFDKGSYTCKLGYANGDSDPEFTFPSLIGDDNHLKTPIDHGIVSDWDDFEALLSSLLYRSNLLNS